MSTLTLEREFPVSPQDVWSFVTLPEHMPKWWGHDNMQITDHELDFTRTGPWHSAITRSDGSVMKMSGVVLAVEPPYRVQFTWAWHDDSDQRGPETVVSFTITDSPGGSRFVLTHEQFATEAIAQQHGQGWTAVLRRLERFIQQRS